MINWCYVTLWLKTFFCLIICTQNVDFWYAWEKTVPEIYRYAYLVLVASHCCVQSTKHCARRPNSNTTPLHLKTKPRLQERQILVFLDEQFLCKSDAVYVHPSHVMKFWRNTRVHLHKTEIETPKDIFTAEYMLKKFSCFCELFWHIYEILVESVLSILRFPAISVDTAWMNCQC